MWKVDVESGCGLWIEDLKGGAVPDLTHTLLTKNSKFKGLNNCKYYCEIYSVSSMSNSQNIVIVLPLQ